MHRAFCGAHWLELPTTLRLALNTSYRVGHVQSVEYWRTWRGAVGRLARGNVA
jgi:hypothetical protein